MAINLADNLRIGQQKPVDSRYFDVTLPGLIPWQSLADVKNQTSGIPTPQRFQGLTVNILGVEYWWRDGISDEQLVIKTFGSEISLGAIGLAPNANAATLTSGVLNLEPASASFGGVVTTGEQTFEGFKTFIKDLEVNNMRVGLGGGYLENNTAIGREVLGLNSTGFKNTGIGSRALLSNSTGNGNTAVGANALAFNTTGVSNTGIGLQALFKVGGGNNNTAIGTNSLRDSTASGNTAVGTRALADNTTGYDNIAIGVESLHTNLTGYDNIAIGNESLRKNKGSNNTAIGKHALYNNTTGGNNVAIGGSALFNNEVGSTNTAIGGNALFENKTGGSNIAIGHSSLSNLKLGSNNIGIGMSTSLLTKSDSNSIVIGNGAVGLGSNITVIGNASTVQTSIVGRITLGTTTDNGVDRLQVLGSVIINPVAPANSPFFTHNFTTISPFTQSAGNDANWTIVAGEAQSGSIPDKSKSGIEYTFNAITSVTKLSYTYRTSTEQDYDYLFVKVDGRIIKAYSGTIATTTDSFNINGSGLHTIQFVYSKDFAIVAAPDTVWIDNVTLTRDVNNLTVYGDSLLNKIQAGDLSITGVASAKRFYADTGFEIFDSLGDRRATLSQSAIVFFDTINNLPGSSIIGRNLNIIQSADGVNPRDTYPTLNTGDLNPLIPGTYFIQSPSPLMQMHLGQFAGGGAPTGMLNVNGTSVFKDNITMVLSPTLSSEGYEILTRNTSSGIIEKIPSSSIGAGTYVPYTGATSTVNLGANNLVIGSGGANGANITMEGNTTTSYIKMFNTGQQAVYNASTIVYTSIQYGGTKTLYLSTNAITGNDYSIFLPDATGTVALTSDLSGFVTLANPQTITGLKTFTSQIIIDSTTNSVLTFNVSGANKAEIASNSAFFQFSANNTDGYLFKNSAAANALAITQTGNATFLGTVTAVGFFNTSDAKLKNIIERDGDTVKFTWKDKRDDKIHIGYIAQEVQEKYPDQVSADKDGSLTVNYIEVLVAKIQELENRIKQLEK